MKHFLLFALTWGICFASIHAQTKDRVLVQSYVDSLSKLVKGSKYDQILSYGEAAIQSAISKIGEQDTLLALLYSKVAYAYLIKHQVDKALPYLEASKDMWTTLVGPNHIEVGRNVHDIAKANYLSGNFQQGVMNCEQALEIFRSSLGEDHLELSGPYNTLGGLHVYLGENEKVLFYYQKALDIRLKNLKPDHPYIGMSYNNVGIAYEIKDDYERARTYLEKGLDIKKQTYGENHLTVSNSYGTLATLLRRTGELGLARTYQQKSLDIAVDILGTEQHSLVAASYFELGNIENLLANHEKALLLLNRALEIQQVTLPPNHPEIAVSYVGIGSVHRLLNQKEEELEAYLQALSMLETSEMANRPNIATVLFNIGGHYKDQEDFQQALEYYQKSLSISLSEYGISHSITTDIYVHMADMYSRLGEDQKALEYFDKGLHLQEEIIGKHHPRMVYGYDRLGYHYYSRKQYELAQEIYEKTIGYINHIQQAQQSIETKQTYFSDLIFVYENAIQNILEASKEKPANFDINKAFTYSEQAKSRILREALNSSKANTFAGIPDSLLQQAYDLRIDIAYYEKKSFEEEEKGNTRNDSLIKEYRNRLITLQQKHSGLISLFEESYPAYYRLKFDTEVMSIKEVQANLQDQEALIEYFIGKYKNYVLVILKDSFICHQMNSEFPLEERVRQMRYGMFHYHLSSNIHAVDYSAYNDTFVLASIDLYQYLIAPFQEVLPERLFIIPSGILGYLPFEALLTERPDQTQSFKSHSYLLRQYQISYCYSATLLEEMQSQARPRFSDRLLAMAPSFELEKPSYASILEQRAGLGPLLYNVPEVNSIQELLGGTVISGKAATKDQFIDQCSRAQILHLATHGKANDAAGEYSYLAFAESSDSLIDQKLYARELYTLHIPADLVVLSACETGIGELQFGEGIVSLARGFSYAGARSILTSLWRVSDVSTAELMQSFYAHLRQGMPKDAALRQAKLEFLEKHPHDEAHPYFWAGFVPIGDMAPIELQRNYWPLLIGVLFLLVIGLGFWRIRGNKAKAS